MEPAVPLGDSQCPPNASFPEPAGTCTPLSLPKAVTPLSARPPHAIPCCPLQIVQALAPPRRGISTPADQLLATSHGPLPGDRVTARAGGARLCGDTAATWGSMSHGYSRMGTGTAPRRMWRRRSVPPLWHMPQWQSGVTPAPLWLLGPAPQNPPGQGTYGPEMERRAKSSSATVLTKIPGATLPRALEDKHKVPSLVSFHIPNETRVPSAKEPHGSKSTTAHTAHQAHYP